MNKKWENREIQYLKENYGKILNRILSKHLNRSTNSIFNKAKKIGLKSSQSKMASISNKKWSHDEFFFKNVSEKSSYWAGFIAADGTITNGKYKSLQIKLQKKDEDHLKIFKKDIKYTGELIYSSQIGKKNNIYYSCTINIYCADNILFDLERIYNISDRKTFCLTPPKIKDYNLCLAYIIGFIDGDGCICRYLQKKKYPYTEICIVGTFDVMKWIKDFLEKEMKIKTSSIKKVGKIYRISIYGNSIAENFIRMAKKIDVPFLKRKWD